MRAWLSPVYLVFLVFIFLVCSLDAPVSPNNPQNEVTLLAVGDVMLSRSVAAKIRATKDPSWPFRNIADTLHSGDVLFGNLEGAICNAREVHSGEMVFHADPGEEKALQSAGFTLMSLANNHFPDFGGRCIAESLARLDSAKIAHAGAGFNAKDAAQPGIVKKKGLRIALLAYNDSDVVPAIYYAAEKHAGTNPMLAPAMMDAVRSARRQADIVIVSMHSGTEY